MHAEGLMQKLLFQLCEPTVTVRKVTLASRIATRLLREHFTAGDVSRLGLFLVYTLPPFSSVSETCDRSSDSEEAVFQTLGPDWFLLFLRPHLHASTVQLGLVLLTHLLAQPCQLEGFREGVLAGTLIESIEEPFALMDNLRAHSWSYECLSATCPGFDALRWLLFGHSHLPRVYGALATLLLGKKASHAPQGQQTLDDILQSVIDDQEAASVQQLCPEPAAILLELVKVIMTLGIHPTRKQVCDFMRILLMDSLLNVPASANNTHPILLLLEFSPEGASLDQRQSFQTELLEFLMEILYMVSEEENHTHLHSPEPGGQVPDRRMGVLMENVVVFGKTLVQKLHEGVFLGEPENLLNFLADQIVVRSQSEQEVVIKTLQTLEARWAVVMATYNANVAFVTCLLHCLQLIHSGRCFTGTNTRPTSSASPPSLTQVMAERQHVLEDAYKIEISANHAAEAGPTAIGDVSPLWQETASKAWQIHTGQEKNER
ncbi:hypothetical protein CRUP_014003 [Coryphaenoides rupestris]|nr:hypothetical protein CRUP_014003 [Coryphaenoides rupestris]